MTDATQVSQFIKLIQLPVFAAFTVKSGVCSCGAAASCQSPGKHPKAKRWQAIAKGVTESAPLVDGVIRGVSNYGIATNGQAFVLDFDGAMGCEVFTYLASQLPVLQTAPRVRTQSGGLHVYLQHPLGERLEIRNKTKHLPGMDVRGRGGFVVGPGSCGVQGTYLIEHCELPSEQLDGRA